MGAEGTSMTAPQHPLPTLTHDADMLPCIDLAVLRNSTSSNRVKLLEDMKKAVSEWGFFQVINHAIPEDLVLEIMTWGRKVFEMPLERKTAAGNDYQRALGDAVRWREALHTWADQEKFTLIADKLWPDCQKTAEQSKNIHHKFSAAVEELGLEILHLLEEALGVKIGDFSQHWEPAKRTFIRFNYYPPSEQPDSVFGAGPHTDPSIITLLCQDGVGGLEILKDDNWIPCKPLAGSFLVNIGDCLQIYSNDAYPSVNHRALVNTRKARLSIASFIFPKDGIEIKPAGSLVDAQHPAQFRACSFGELVAATRANQLNGKEKLSAYRLIGNS